MSKEELAQTKAKIMGMTLEEIYETFDWIQRRLAYCIACHKPEPIGDAFFAHLLESELLRRERETEITQSEKLLSNPW